METQLVCSFDSPNCRTAFHSAPLLGEILFILIFLHVVSRGYILRSCIEGSADAIYTRYCNFVKVIFELSVPYSQSYSIKDHFNYLVTHNAMKWQPCEKREGVFSYEDADGAVAWAKANKMPMRGHALLWATGTNINTKGTSPPPKKRLFLGL